MTDDDLTRHLKDILATAGVDLHAPCPEQMQAAINRLRLAVNAESSPWQPIATAPRDGTRVLLWWEDVTDAPFVGYYSMGKWRDMNGNTYTQFGAPTHWMPLPPKPDTKEG